MKLLLNGRKFTLCLLLAMAASVTAGLSGCRANQPAAANATKTAKPDAAISVSVSEPKKKSVQGVLTLNGTVHTENEVNVVAETSGKVLKIYADTGMRVSRGDLLAQIDDELKQASYKTAQAGYDKAKSDWSKAQDLFDQKVISDSDLQGAKLAFANADSQLLMARRDYDNAKVRAPQGGVVTQKFVSVGSMMSSGTQVVHIVDTDNLKLTVQVSERDILKMRVNMSVSIDSDLYPGIVFSGKVSAISPKGDSALTFPVEIALKTDARKPLYDGMSAKAHVNFGAKTIVAIPRAAIVGARETPQVFVVKDGIAKLVTIVTGGEYDTDIEVLKGLAETDQVVVEGQNNLNDDASVTVAETAAK